MSNKEDIKRKGCIYAAAIGLVFAASLLVNALTVFINYPTEAHRSAARQIEEMSVETLMQGNSTSNLEKYKKLSESAEIEYITAASIGVLFLSLAATVVMIGVVYNYLRKRHVTEKPVFVTAVVVTLGTLISTAIFAYLSAMYVGVELPRIGFLFGSVVMSAVLSLLINAVIARFFELRYNRKYSLLID